eukprot:SAG31_NODE_1735_length_7410_cov_2.762960_8_plen_41_part_00
MLPEADTERRTIQAQIDELKAALVRPRQILLRRQEPHSLY